MQHVHGYEISMSSAGVGILKKKKKSVGVGQCSYLLIPIWEICEAPHIPKQASESDMGEVKSSHSMPRGA